MVNKQGGHVLINLNIGEEVTRHGKVTELPVTDVITKSFEHIDSSQTTKGLKIKNKETFIYHLTNWIVGV